MSQVDKWIATRQPSAVVPASKAIPPVGPREGDKIRVPGRCSKTGAAIEWRVTYIKGEWQLQEITLTGRPTMPTASAASRAGTNASAPAPVSIPGFRDDERKAFCPACHIRVKKGPTFFECCGFLHCMGSHCIANGAVMVVCRVCNVQGPLGGYIQQVRGSEDGRTAPSKQPEHPPRSPVSALPANPAKRLK